MSSIEARTTSRESTPDKAGAVAMPPAPDDAPRPFGLLFEAKTESELADELASVLPPPGSGAHAVFTANLNHIVDLRRDPEFRAAYKAAWKVTADGTPVFLYARLRGVPLPGRLTGSGLFPLLMARLDPARHRIFFVAPSEAAAKGCADDLLRRGFPRDAVRSCVPAVGFEKNAAYSSSLAEDIRRQGTTHLFLGVGAPKSEKWVHTHAAALGDCYILCIGASLEFYVGLKSRGPEWMRKAGLEWLWRFGQEPTRLFNRYFVRSWLFLLAVADDLRGRTLLR